MDVWLDEGLQNILLDLAFPSAAFELWFHGSLMGNNIYTQV